MEQQSDNNLDTLFQKAAEEYPLKTNNKNWNIVAAKLHLSPNVLQTKSRKWQSLTLLLLLLLGGSVLVVNNSNKKNPSVSANQKSAISAKQKNNSEQQIENVERHPSISTDNNDLTHAGNTTNRYSGLEKTITTFKNKTSAIANSTNKQTNNFSDQIQQGQQPKLTADKNKVGELRIEKANISSLMNQSITKEFNKTINSNTDIADNAGSNNQKSTHVSLRAQPKTFYGMFFFSPAFSTVKFQHINKPGYSIGIGLGYRINSRLSTELGLQRIHTNFYSDGKYFDTSNIKIKRSSKLDALNGNNKLTAIPIALRYNLLKNNYHFFATGGTTIALITHTEKYDYNVIKKNGDPKDVYRTFSSLTGTKFFSSVNLSLGYETSVSKIFNVKIEPYFQLATKGLGVGNLPINNFGLNVGIIKNFK